MPLQHLTAGMDRNFVFHGGARSPPATGTVVATDPTQPFGNAADKSPKIESPELGRISPNARGSGPSSPASASELQMIEKPSIFAKPPLPKPKTPVARRTSPRRKTIATSRETPKATTATQADLPGSPGRLKRPSPRSVPVKSTAKTPKKKPRRDIFEVDTDIESSQDLPRLPDHPPRRSSLGLRKTPNARKFIFPDAEKPEKQNSGMQLTREPTKDKSVSSNERDTEGRTDDSRDGAANGAEEFVDVDTMDVELPVNTSNQQGKQLTAKSVKAAAPKGEDQPKISKAPKAKKPPKSEATVIDLDDEKDDNTPRKSRLTQKGEPPKKRGRPTKAEQQAKLEAQQAANKSQGSMENHVDRTPKLARANKSSTKKTTQDHKDGREQKASDSKKRSHTPEPKAPTQAEVIEDQSRRSAMKAEKLAKKISDEHNEVEKLSSGLARTPHRRKSITPHIPGRSTSRSSRLSRSNSSASRSNRGQNEQRKKFAQTPSRTAPKSQKKLEPPKVHKDSEVSGEEETKIASKIPPAKPSISVKPAAKISLNTARSESVDSGISVTKSRQQTYYSQLFAMARASHERSQAPGPAPPEPTTRKPTEEPTAKKPTAEKPTAEKPITQNSTVQKPTMQILGAKSQSNMKKSPLRTLTKADEEDSKKALPSKVELDKAQSKAPRSSVKGKPAAGISATSTSNGLDMGPEPARKNSASPTEEGSTASASARTENRLGDESDASGSTNPSNAKLSRVKATSYSRSPARVVPQKSHSSSETSSDADDVSVDSDDSSGKLGSEASSEPSGDSGSEDGSESESESESEREDSNESMSETEHSRDQKGIREESTKPKQLSTVHKQGNSITSTASTPSASDSGQPGLRNSISKANGHAQPAAPKPAKKSAPSPSDSHSSLDAQGAAKQLQLESSGPILTPVASQTLTEPKHSVSQTSHASSSAKTPTITPSRPSFNAQGKYPSLSGLKSSGSLHAPVEYPRLPSYKMPLDNSKRAFAAPESSSESATGESDDDEDEESASKTPTATKLGTSGGKGPSAPSSKGRRGFEELIARKSFLGAALSYLLGKKMHSDG